MKNFLYTQSTKANAGRNREYKVLRNNYPCLLQSTLIVRGCCNEEPSDQSKKNLNLFFLPQKKTTLKPNFPPGFFLLSCPFLVSVLYCFLHRKSEARISLSTLHAASLCRVTHSQTLFFALNSRLRLILAWPHQPVQCCCWPNPSAHPPQKHPAGAGPEQE